jgi:hypothetical protein
MESIISLAKTLYGAKKYSALIAIMIVLLLVATACASSGSSPPPPTGPIGGGCG